MPRVLRQLVGVGLVIFARKPGCFAFPAQGFLPQAQFRGMLNLSSTLSSEELVEIVDECNVPTSPQKRSVMRRDRLIHRATYAFVKDRDNYFYVQKRSKYKDYCPGYFDPTPGGVVGAGESYADTNTREVEEEMGIPSSVPCTHLFTHYYEDERLRCFGDAWELTYDGPLKLQKEEVESVHKMTMQEIISRYEAGEPFTPDSLRFCYEYVKARGMPDLPARPPQTPELL
jgi:8-oxo-dGTP pyrophosphatase MutT (NUDIX family)